MSVGGVHDHVRQQDVVHFRHRLAASVRYDLTRLEVFEIVVDRRPAGGLSHGGLFHVRFLTRLVRLYSSTAAPLASVPRVCQVTMPNPGRLSVSRRETTSLSA